MANEWFNLKCDGSIETSEGDIPNVHRKAVDSYVQQRILEALSTSCGYCGDLMWTARLYGRIVHKHSCPHRREIICQSHSNCEAPKNPCCNHDPNRNCICVNCHGVLPYRFSQLMGEVEKLPGSPQQTACVILIGEIRDEVCYPSPITQARLERAKEAYEAFRKSL